MESPQVQQDRARKRDREHDEIQHHIEMHTKQIEAFSVAAMRAPAIAAAGGVAASLGFYSANYPRLADKPEAISSFNDAVWWLFVSILLTVTAPSFAYLSQLAYQGRLFNVIRLDREPFVRFPLKSRIYGWAGDASRIIASCLVVAAIVAVVIGGLEFLNMIATLNGASD